MRAFKTDLKELSASLLAMNLDDHDKFYASQHELEELAFKCDLMIRKLLVTGSTPTTTPPLAPDGKGVRLPKLEAPTFDGKFTNWILFWEQFVVAIHSRDTLSDVEKLAYLCNSLKNGSAKGIIDGLSTSDEFYAEAVETLKARYDRPRLIHQSHVREVPGLKEGTGREIRRFHDTVQQHLRALKSMGHEPSGPFITSILELKLDTDTNFEWQKVSQDSPDFPHYSKLLEFLDLRAQASEASTADVKRHVPHTENYSKKGSLNKPITSFMAGASDLPSPSCALCNIPCSCALVSRL